MRSFLRLVGVVVSGLLCAVSLAELHPHPYLYDDWITFGSFVFYMLVYAVSPARGRSFTVRFALLTAVVFFVLDLWYWIGAWKFGLWYPHAPEIVERFMQVDGESGYNAEVSNLFLFVWPTALFLWWLRKTMSKDGLTPNE